MLGLPKYTDRFNRWLWSPGSEPGRFERILRNTCRVIYAVGCDLTRGKITLHAMGLVYTTLLSIVPFLALSFSVLKGFGVHNQMRPALESVLADPLGERAEPIINNVLQFVDNIEVGVLGSVGLGFLIYTVIALVQKIERSFNEIWHVSHVRSFAQRFSNYLSVIMVGPLLVFAALGITAAFVGSDFVSQATSIEAVGWIFSVIGRFVPYLVIIGLFTFLYMFIPNTNVMAGPALVGGFVAGVTWQSLGFGFTIFVASATNYTAIYSGFAIGIFLLIWLYLVWLLLLVGASVSFHVQHVRNIVPGVEETSAILDEYVGLAIIYRVGRCFDDGAALKIAQIESGFSLGPGTARRVMDKLIDKDIIALAGEAGDRLVPAQPFDRLEMSRVLAVVREPATSLPEAIVSERSVVNVAEKIAASVQQSVEGTVADWVRGAER